MGHCPGLHCTPGVVLFLASSRTFSQRDELTLLEEGEHRMASTNLRKRRRRFGHPAWWFAPGPTIHRSWPQVKWERVRKALTTTLCHGGTSLWDGHLPVFQDTHCLTFLEQAAPTTSDLPEILYRISVFIYLYIYRI